uniref:Putative secreted protein n=1 Tax=Amblyomma parvum TaxID=251391 RepID=A0A023G2F5_AMBPA
MKPGGIMIGVLVAFSLVVVATSLEKFSNISQNRQHIEDLIGLNGKLYVKQRNYGTETHDRCHSAEKQEGSGDCFTYTLRFQPNGTGENLIGYNTTVKIFATEGYTKPNAANYSFGPRFRVKMRELLFINKKTIAQSWWKSSIMGKMGAS